MVKKLTLIALLILFTIQTGFSTIITRTWTWQYNPWGSITYNVIMYRPDNATGKLPAFIFFPGSGESGTDASKLYVNGPLYFIKNAGWKPNFIVVGVQTYVNYPGDPVWVQNALDSLHEPIYNIDWNHWYMTGLSYGAATIMGYMLNSPDSTFMKPAAAIPMSISINPQCGQTLCGTDLRFMNIGMWGFCGDADAFYSSMSQYFNLLITSGYPAQFTTLAGEGHCCWNGQYDPNYKYNGTNIYNWALGYSNGSPLPIDLLDFTTIYSNGLTTVEWTTGSESNSDYFSVEQSDDGIHFYRVGRVDSKAQNGTSSSPIHYKFQY